MQPDFKTLKPVQTGQPDFATLKPVGGVSITPEKKQNYFQRVGSSYMKAGQEVIKDISARGQYPGQSILRVAGDVAGAAFTPILEAPGIKQATEYITEKIASNEKIQPIINKATDLALKYPNIAKDLGSVVNILSLGVGGAGIKETKAIGSDIAQGTKILLTPAEETIQKNVIELFNKAIKPTAKKTVTQAERYDDSIINGLKTIKQNAPELNITDVTGEIIQGRTPQTIQELAQGLNQTKDIVFKQYDDLAKKAGTQGAVIDAKPIAEEVLKVAQNKAIQLANPELIKYAENWAERLKNFDVLDTETTQEVIKLMNNNLQSFYKNPTYDSATKVAVDAGIANNFRQALDKAIEGATGGQYQALKNQYSALKAIENDVVRASLREGRKNTKGLLDYTDMFTGGQMVSGILSLNPAMFTKGAIERGIKEYIKFLNDPNRAISNIFDKLDITPRQTFTPKSSTVQYLKNPKVGLSVQDVSGIPKSITPESIAKKVSAGEIKRINNYINNNDIKSFMEGISILEKYKLDKADPETLKRFLIEVRDVYQNTTNQ